MSTELNVTQTVITSLTFGIVGLFFWMYKKDNGKKEDTRERLIKLETKHEAMEKNWEKGNVDKAYASAKRAHERIDKLKGE